MSSWSLLGQRNEASSKGLKVYDQVSTYLPTWSSRDCTVPASTMVSMWAWIRMERKLSSVVWRGSQALAAVCTAA